MKIEIECPYCGKIHVHTLPGLRFIDSTPKEEKQLPQDEETDDLENFREGG